MYFVYILKSLRDNNLYTGCTEDISKRLKAHNSGKVKSTQKRKPFALVYFEEYKTLKEARKRENYLKTLKGGRTKHSLIDSFSKELLSKFVNSRGPGSNSEKLSNGPAVAKHSSDTSRGGAVW